MSTNSERHRVQLFVEGKIGCPDSDSLPSFQTSLESYQISGLDRPLIQACATEDAESYFRKSLQSYLQGLLGLHKSHETWSMVKFYYACFYMLRADLLYNNYSTLRCKNIYTLELKLNEKPKKKTGNEFRGDHKATIKIYKDAFPAEILLSQAIDGKNPLDWLVEKREWVNYRRKDFIDGQGMPGLSDESQSYPSQIESCCQDDIPIFCFDPDVACLTYPTKFIQSKIRRYDPARSLLASVLSEFDARDRSGSIVASFLKHV